MVSITGSAFLSCSVAEVAAAALRKNTVAALASVEVEPDAILTFVEFNVENPALASLDQRTCEAPTDETPDPIDSTHACVALTLSESPCVDALMFPTPATERAVVAKAPTWTFTLGGTVTLTMWVRLLDDPYCAAAGREIIAVPITAASSVRRSPTIFRASSYREPLLSGGRFV
jgi:hypothetical protein